MMSLCRKHFKSALPAFFVSIAFMFFPFTVFGNQNCQWNIEIVRQQNEYLSGDLRQRILAELQLRKALSQAANQAFQDYLVNDFGKYKAVACMKPISNSKDLSNLIQLSFLTNTLATLRTSKSETLIKLIRLLDSRFSKTSTLIFRLSGGNAFEASPTDLQAGFHRGTTSIFMDVGRVSPSEWNIIFIHELIHFLDIKIRDGSEKYFQKSNTPERIVQWAQHTNEPSAIPSDDLAEFESFLEAGLDRGYLAEARAWSITLMIYQEGLLHNEWPKIEWLERMISEKTTNENYQQFSLRFLANRTTQPAESIFHWSLTRNLLTELIDKFVQGKKPFTFGQLDTLF